MVLRVEPVERHDLEAWLQELDNLPGRILQKKSLLSSVEAQLLQLHQHKSSVANDIEVAKKKGRAADARQRVLETRNMIEQLRGRKEKHATDSQTLDALDAAIKVQELQLLEAEKDQDDFKNTIDLPALENARKKAQADLQERRQENQRVSDAIKEHENERGRVEEEIKVLEARQSALLANPTVSRFSYEPHLLIATLREDVDKQIATFKQLFPAGQSEPLRLVLAQLPGMLEQIHLAVPGIGIPAERVKQYRQAFYECCGLLYAMMDFATHDNFRERMKALLERYSINEAQVREAYEKNKLALKTAQEFDFAQYERDEYAKAKSQLTGWLAQAEEGSLKRRATALVDAITADEGDSNFDRPYYTQFLKDTVEAVKAPEDKDKRAQYRNTLRSIPDGKPSTWRKIAGCGLVLLGVLIFAGSAVAKCLSLGVAAPITIAGMVGGGLLVVAGIGLFASGCSRGNHKKGFALQESLEKSAKKMKLN